MASTLDDVRRILSPDELDYPAAAAELGPEALPHLQTLATSDDPHFASKAAYAATLIDGADRPDVLAAAAENPLVVVRLAVASGAANLPVETAEPLLAQLLGDADAGVRKFAVRSAAATGTPALQEQIGQLAINDPEPFVRDIAAGGTFA